jgi:hypothetical protein
MPSLTPHGRRDIETVPDLKGFAAANGHLGKSDDEVRAELGDKSRNISTTRLSVWGRWLPIVKKAVVGRSMAGTAHRRAIRAGVDRFLREIEFAALSPQLVAFNGLSFDLAPGPSFRVLV